MLTKLQVPFRIVGLLVLIAGTLPLPAADDSPLRIAKFDVDATPPVGFPMAYDRVRRVEELGLRARGIVLTGAGDPIVLCAVDWIGIGNGGHDAFRDALAQAAGTTRQRVAVHALHQHDAPRCDFSAEQLLLEAGVSDVGAYESSFARELLQRLSQAISEAVTRTTEVTHVGFGTATVDSVASNRRILDDQGKVRAMRFTACRDPELRDEPAGTVDPQLDAVTFYHHDQPLAVLSYFATHPQSYYRTGIPSPDFPGIARFMRGQAVPDVLHVHFTGAGGNVGAGKYNDGSPEQRMQLATRLAAAMRQAYESASKQPVVAADVQWETVPVALSPAPHFDEAALRQAVQQWQANQPTGAPDELAWLLRCQAGHKIDLACLKIGDIRILHMPGELFVEYQLAAKELRPEWKVAMAAYGDYAPGYIGTEVAYSEGGYETSSRASSVDRTAEAVLMRGIKDLLDLEEDYADELPRIPPTPPEQAEATFRVADGFQMQQVAAEPLIGSPVAIEWDADGRLYVCEMRGYSENRDDGISRVTRLEDSDDDGVFDKSVVFVDGLLWPTAIFPFDGGLFVGDAPHLYYCKDTDGDGTADQQQIVLTGFGTSNVQGLLNSFRWNLDNQIEIACSSAGGTVQRPGETESVNVRGRDLTFDPRSFEFALTSAAAQHGMCFDDWGRKFVSSNSDHLQQVMYEDRYIGRNKYVAAPPARISIAADGPQAEVYRSSPVEPWRIVRTRLRKSGTVPGVVEGGGRAAGYFTGATGVTIYRGDAWADKWRGLAVVGDVGSNLVHRKRLEQQGLQFTGRRIDPQSELVASTDIWFRPAQFAHGPDGSLHVIDVYREVIEHPLSLPPVIKQHLDLTAGRDRGRIYRLVPDGFQHRPTPRLSQATTAQLVALLAHPNQWHRETAARLLYERQDPAAVKPLRELANASDSPLGRMHALYALDGLDALDAAVLLPRFDDQHPQVRRHAVRLSERHHDSALLTKVAALAQDPSLEVRYQLAFSAGELPLTDRVAVLAEIVRRDHDNRWVRAAVHSSLRDGAGEMLALLLADPDFRSPAAVEWLGQLADQISGQNRTADFELVLAALENLPDQNISFALPIIGPLLGSRSQPGTVLSALDQQGRLRQLDHQVQRMITDAAAAASRESAALEKRLTAIDHLRYGRWEAVQPPLVDLIDNRHPQAIQQAALRTLGTFTRDGVAPAIIDAWAELSPSVRETASDVLFARPERVLALLDAVDGGLISGGDVSRARWQVALNTESIAARVRQQLERSGTQVRQEVIAAYTDALTLEADFDRGRVAFGKHCAGCHKIGDQGHEIGPNLAAMTSRGPEAILVNVLDPNREVNPQYLNYVVLTEDGRTATGMIASENANSITLRRAEGVTDAVRRDEIAQLKSTGLSIMPEGLEESIDKQAMADIIGYLMQLQP